MENVKIHLYLAVDDETTADFEAQALQTGHRLNFSDKEGFRYLIEYEQTKIHVERTGSTQMILTLIAHQPSEGSFQSEQLAFTFQIMTKELVISPRYLKAEYQLMDHQTITSRHIMVMEWI